MKIGKVLFLVLLALSLTGGTPKTCSAEVLLSGIVNGEGLKFDILPAAMYTLDNLLSYPNLYTITVTNVGTKKVTRLVVKYKLSNPAYGGTEDPIVSGDIRVVWDRGVGFLDSLTYGQSYTIVNTMLNQSTKQVITDGGFQDRFVDDAQRIGYLPEGTYNFSFAINPEDPPTSWYADNSAVESASIDESIDIKNPLPPELVTPDQNDNDVPAIPRFTWTKPGVTDFKKINKRELTLFYTIRLWKMFENDGRVLDIETAITRIPIWEVPNWKDTSIDFKPNDSREELISGRSYCWQVQAFDGTGRPISQTNNGKSDVWPFTVKFTPLVINEPLLFYPLRFSWSPAQTGGKVVLYNIFVADNTEFTGAYNERGQVSTSFTYPGSAPRLRFGVGYFIKVQATDDAGIPLGEPVTTSFTLPSLEVTLTSPNDGEVVATKTPTFSWQGEASYHIVTILDQQNNWSFVSTGIEGKSWTYNGEELKPGVTYTWRVTPATQQGEPLGDPSDSWTFTLPSTDQVTVVSPLNTRIETVFPQFTWNLLPSATGSNVLYRIIITDENNEVVYSADVPGTTFTYPTDAPQLLYGARYNWTVGAIISGNEVGRRSNPAWFVTPFVQTSGQEVTVSEIEQAIKTVLADYPQFAGFKEMVLSGITGPGGALTPSQLMEYLDKFKIANVTAK